MAEFNILMRIMADDKASGPLGRVTGALQGMGAHMQTVGRVALGAVGAGMTAIAGGFALAARSAIAMNSTLETSTLQFTTLMGDAEMAEEHVRSLFEFAKNTPFETGAIIEASKQMETFGGAALNTQANLMLIGDAAAATSAPIDELGFWVGRLFSNLQAGQPFGEAAMRLQELAVMSPQARQEMEDLQAAGASADEIFAVFQEDLGKFTGAMESQAGTWKGLTSTISDALQITAATALKPFFDMAKDGLGAVVAFLESPALNSGVDRFAEGLSGIGRGAKYFMDALKEGQSPLRAFSMAWGIIGKSLGLTSGQIARVRNLVIQLGSGISTVLGPVIDFLQNNVKLSDILTVLGIAIASVVIPAVVSLAAAVAPVLLAFAAGVAVVAALRTAWETDFGGIRDFVGGIWTAITQAWDAFKALFQGDFEGFTTGIDTAWRTAWGAVVAFLGNLWAMAQPKLAEWWTAIKTWFGEQDWAGLAQTALDFIIKRMGEFYTQVAVTLAGWFTAFANWVNEQDWESIGFTLMTRLIEKLAEFWSLAVPTVEGWWESIKAWFEETDWGALGREIIGKLVAGLMAAGGAILNALKGLIDGAIAAAIASITGGDGAAPPPQGGNGPGYASGGFTGYGAQAAVAGFVHGQEYVFNAAAVRNLGVGNLDAMHSAAQRGQRVGAVTTNINIDARGATPGMEVRIKAAVEDALRTAGRQADRRMR